ncbi:MAG: SDR family oxidoreductase [Planctomycetota bacterium]|nr:SDR family oxidoreductase [Planctomycetota bacterium]MDA1178180.1 SDR family oxidoreductase [Planctomycetota bacterium]
MSVCLVTGGAGFIGSHLVHALCQRGDRVRVLDNLSTGFRHNITSKEGDVELIEGDIADHDAVAKAMQGVQLVFHQAALASVPRSVKNPLDTNRACVTGTLNVLDQARHAGVRRVVYAASSSAYGDQPFSSKREVDLPAPLSPYAVAKLAGEYYCHAFYRTYGLETVCIRYFNVFGPRQDPNSPYSAVIPLFISSLLQGKPPIVHGDGHQTRDFTYVGNVVHGNLLAAEADATAVAGKSFNVANGKSTSLRELLDLLNSLLGTNLSAQYGPPRAGDVRDSLADISAARKCLGYDPPHTFEEGLERTVEYYKSLYAASK